MRRIRVLTLFAMLGTVAVISALLPPEAQADEPKATRVSVASDGTQGDGNSNDPFITPDSRWVGFDSAAGNLVAGDTNAVADGFVRDRMNNATERVSVADDESQAVGGPSSDVVLNPAGRFATFTSGATNLVAGDTNVASDVFLRDRNNSSTERVSVADDESQSGAGEGSSGGVISSSGQFVAFTSGATNFVAGDTNTVNDVFVRNRTANSTERVSVADDESQAVGGPSTSMDISDDGNLVIFSSDATNLIGASDTNAATDIFLRNRSAGTTERVSVADDESQANGGSTQATASADGRFVAFTSGASNLVSGDTNGVTDVFVRDRQNGTTRRVTVATTNVQGNGASDQPAISSDGTLVAFRSDANNLVNGDTNGVGDIFVHNVQTGKTIRVSEGSQANAASSFPTVSHSNTPFAAFQSAATNLVANDTNGVNDVFVRAARVATGYLILDDVGGFFTFGDAEFFGSVPGLRNAGVNIGQAEVIDMATTPTGDGYLALDAIGGIFAFGDAAFRGSVPGLRNAGTCTCPEASIDIAMTGSGNGYYVLDAAGGIFTFGDATFQGSLPSLRQAGVNVGPARAIDIAVTPTGGGYWILDELGGVFTFGDAQFFGSVPALRNAGVQIGNAPGIRFEATPTGNGYMVLDRAGGIFTFGDARFFGSIPGLRAAGTVVGPAEGVDFAMTPSGDGYYILDHQGGIFTFGDATFFGSVPALRQAGVPIGPAPSIRIDTVGS